MDGGRCWGGSEQIERHEGKAERGIRGATPELHPDQFGTSWDLRLVIWFVKWIGGPCSKATPDRLMRLFSRPF
jgi:hypothetical protein